MADAFSRQQEAKPAADGPLGVLDSGLGGLSVLREIRRQLPAENLLYFADQANLPFGPRPLEQVREITIGITRFLLTLGAKAIVLACNTASAAALYALRDTFPEVPFVGMEPAVKPAAEQTLTGVVGVMATPSTFQGKLYSSLVERFGQSVQVLTAVCPGLVKQVEDGKFESRETVAILENCLAPLLAAGIDTLVLGCTHYPFLTSAIRQVVGREIQIIDPGPAVAQQTARILRKHDLLNHTGRPGRWTCLTSGDPARFQRSATQILAEPDQVIAVNWNPTLGFEGAGTAAPRE